MNEYICITPHQIFIKGDVLYLTERLLYNAHNLQYNSQRFNRPQNMCEIELNTEAVIGKDVSSLCVKRKHWHTTIR